jgi:hypothetical protein
MRSHVNVICFERWRGNVHLRLAPLVFTHQLSGAYLVKQFRGGWSIQITGMNPRASPEPKFRRRVAGYYTLRPRRDCSSFTNKHEMVILPWRKLFNTIYGTQALMAFVSNCINFDG